MIAGLRSEPDLREKQLEFVIARLAMRQFILENFLRAYYTFAEPQTDDERANAVASLELSLKQADDVGQIMAFAADHEELLPRSLR